MIARQASIRGVEFISGLVEAKGPWRGGARG